MTQLPDEQVAVETGDPRHWRLKKERGFRNNANRNKLEVEVALILGSIDVASFLFLISSCLILFEEVGSQEKG